MVLALGAALNGGHITEFELGAAIAATLLWVQGKVNRSVLARMRS